jgi:hypothetical protein
MRNGRKTHFFILGFMLWIRDLTLNGRIIRAALKTNVQKVTIQVERQKWVYSGDSRERNSGNAGIAWYFSGSRPGFKIMEMPLKNNTLGIFLALFKDRSLSLCRGIIN